MEGLIEFIFANLFLVIIIVTGLLSFFKNMLANQNKQGSPNQESERGSPLREAMKRVEEMVESIDVPEQTTPKRTERKVETTTHQSIPIEETVSSFEEQIERQYEEQYSRLQEQYQSISEITEEVNYYNEKASSLIEDHDPKNKKIYNEPDININLKSRLNRGGLIESIVMAEVLGPPRARRGHHRIINR